MSEFIRREELVTILDRLAEDYDKMARYEYDTTCHSMLRAKEDLCRALAHALALHTVDDDV